MSAVVEFKEKQLPEPVARRGIHEAEWRTLANNLYPGAKPESVLMVWDYCKARHLDPLKKPCHIVPMKVGDSWRDVVMPGIYEYRTTATRTGQYMGHSKPTYGPEADYLGVKAPEFCELTVYRWNDASKQRAEYPVTVWFSECVATFWNKDKKGHEVNSRWTKAPRQMLTKCTEAAALREAFPDELGGTHTAEEMDAQVIDLPTTARIDPRPDTSEVNFELRDQWVSKIADLLAQDKEETDIAKDLKEANSELSQFPELFVTVFDKLAADKIISKANYRKYLEKAK